MDEGWSRGGAWGGQQVSAAAALPPVGDLKLGLNPRSQPQLTASYRISGASKEGCPARTAEIRPLFPPGTAELLLKSAGHQQPPPPAPPEAQAGRRARAALDVRRRRPSLLGEDRGDRSLKSHLGEGERERSPGHPSDQSFLHHPALALAAQRSCGRWLPADAGLRIERLSPHPGWVASLSLGH